MSEQPVLTDATVVALVSQYGNGATGRDLLTSLVSAGYETREAQRYIQRNLDRKTIILGPGLRIYSPTHQQEPTMGLLEELAVRCEAALPWEVDNSPHFHNMRALDLEIARAVRWDSAIGYGRGDRYGVPAYTASMDAAMTLVPKKCVYTVLTDYELPGRARVHGEFTTSRSDAATPALALTAASLRARHALALSKGDVA